MRIVGVALLCVVVTPAWAHGQTLASPYHSEMRAAAQLQLTVQRATPAVTSPALNGDLLAPERFSSRAPGATLMIIGGAGVLAGILIGGSGGALLILGGVGIGAYGVYLYTR